MNKGSLNILISTFINYILSVLSQRFTWWLF